MNCPKCGSANSAGARFCRNCGQALSTSRSTKQSVGSIAGLDWLRMPANWKMLLPFIGIGIVILGMLLPWLTGNGGRISGFATAGLVAVDAQAGYDVPRLVVLSMVAFWVAFGCAVAGHIVLWRHSIARIIAVVASGLGLLAMAGITLVLFGKGGEDYFGSMKFGFGLAISFAGFVLMLVGTFLSWKELGGEGTVSGSGESTRTSGFQWLRPAFTWNMLAPFAGMALVILGFVLPWLSDGESFYSGLTVENLIFNNVTQSLKSGGDVMARIFLWLVCFWIAFTCALLVHLVIWKHRSTRLIVLIAGGVGVAMMIILSILTFSKAGEAVFSGLSVGAGFILTWIGFVVIVRKMVSAWKDLGATAE
jgi:hypothetical protein